MVSKQTASAVQRPARALAGCPVCGGSRVERFWEAADLPVFCNVLCATREEALGMPRGDIHLAFCRGCGFINNRAFDASRLEYSVSYENSLHFSPRFQAYADDLARRLVDRYDLRGKDILEIACGQGDFLRALCALGGNRGVGFDPSHQPAAGESDQLTFVQDYYGPRYADRRADFVCCRHALEHVADPVGFLREVRASIGERHETVVFFEVPNALYTLRDMGIWDLIYEHCNYFVASSLRRSFEQAGFEALAVGDEYGGQFLTIEARPAEEPGCEPDDVSAVAADVEAFAGRYREKVADWRGRMDALRRDGRKAVVWGAGSKGVTFLNIVQPQDRVEYIVDVNPRKRGKFAAGAGQRIIAPEELRECRPHVTIVMNPLYVDEVRKALEDLGVESEIMLA